MPINIPSLEKKEKKIEYTPYLRPELKLQKAPDDIDGSPMFTIYDPIAGQYFKISGSEAIIVKEMEPGISLPDLVQKINKKTTAQLTEEDLKAFFNDAALNNLLVRSKSSEEVIKESKAKKQNAFSWLLLHYLYFKLPLINPNNFLERTLPTVKPLFSKYALILYAFISLSGMMLLFTRIDEFIHTFTYFFNFQGLLTYGIAITLIKIIHEFSHAYIAKYYKVYVPTIGVAFIVLWPVLYTDVTDSWKLTNRYQRLAISFAGIGAELVLAGFATWGWLLSEPGLLQSCFFLIASTTWISSLLINLNPLMRFDGYYILSDLWGIDNLQNRAFTLTRWELRKWFLGIKGDYTEELPEKTRVGLITYSLLTWAYRLSLYIVVAFFVYYKFGKVLGIFLFLVEIGVFIVWPIVDEIVFLVRSRSAIKPNWRLFCSTAVAIAGLTWFIIPLAHRNQYPAVVVPFEKQVFYVPYDSVVEAIYIQKGQTVSKGDPIILLESKPLETDIQTLKIDEKRIRKGILALGLNDELKGNIPESNQELSSVKAHLEQLQAIEQQLKMTAHISGKVYDLMEPLNVGQYVKRDVELAKIADFSDLQVVCYVPENQIADLQVGGKVVFKLNNHAASAAGKIISITPYNEKNLEFPQLSSLHSGELPVVKDHTTGKLQLVESYYEVVVQLEEIPKVLNIGQTGHIDIYSSDQSTFMHYLKKLYVQFWKEISL